mmetsp:Transcript_19473/g.33506  ORF Transcript_19473/g.33506 Transcript_19473/m.33506 type:complete len:87 (-) Transcript_19473:264-524(-)|eukprot:CAMPEP_0184692608 /NCGR_PEP_ID=MMETSP0313-20130426/1017_1 /TAXON_ID=2792 /ORGANISM="Porphyridium aerugineum, Strain SAG 1380-2" /LENGTH=86 /DNA_ID=CAMNT_0027150449 /DNA_START=70 /DNA_END=330 /DNA_ORIENTATION=+
MKDKKQPETIAMPHNDTPTSYIITMDGSHTSAKNEPITAIPEASWNRSGRPRMVMPRNASRKQADHAPSPRRTTASSQLDVPVDIK